MKFIILLAVCFSVTWAEIIDDLKEATSALKSRKFMLREALSSTKLAWLIFGTKIQKLAEQSDRTEYLNTLHENMNILSSSCLINVLQQLDWGDDSSINSFESERIEERKAAISNSFSSIIEVLNNPAHGARDTIKVASEEVYINFGHILYVMIQYYSKKWTCLNMLRS